jgi:hypothetical protein
LYLDLPYIARKTWQGLCITFEEWLNRASKPKSAADKYTLVDENDQVVEKSKK